jgi:hypothetical protein
MTNTAVPNHTTGKPISLELARNWTKNYSEKNPDSTKAHFFGRNIIERILAEDGCAGIRMYYATDEKGESQLLLVGVDTEGNNLLPIDSKSIDEGNIVADYSWPCPSYCSPPPKGDL